MPSFSARSLTVMPDGTLTGPVGDLGLALGLCPGRAALAPHGRLAPGLGVDDDPALALGRGAALRPGSTAGLSRPLLARAPPPSRRTRGGPLPDLRFRQPSTPVNPPMRPVAASTATRSSRSGGTVTMHRSLLGIAPRLRACAAQCLVRAQVHPAARQAAVAIDHELAVDDADPHQLRLRPAPAAAGALPHRSAHREDARPSSPPPARCAPEPRSSGCRRAPGWGSACRTRSRRCSGRGTRPPRPSRPCRAASESSV